MKVLAIDPGTEKSGFVLFDGNRMHEKGWVDNEEIMGLFSYLDADKVAIEMVASYGMPVGKSTFETVLWIGRMVQECFHHDLEAELIYRKDIKMFLCNSMKAKDSNIRQALVDVYGTTGRKKSPNPAYDDGRIKMNGHMWSSLAIAHYVLNRPLA